MTAPHPEAVRRGFVDETGAIPTARSKAIRAASAVDPVTGALKGSMPDLLRRASIVGPTGAVDPSKVKGRRARIIEGGKP